ncbi:Hsp20/alpha crystallin family protein [Thermoflavimicrobium dichotomicum]|uniref:HSP20 family protein n=1 Tax=Thermoflavimicrobium dichotomicum TaxID=46223 RepID=A0A1I3PQT9_9BACL|nr:Hsp20/alpha crystallin family protein [Thermoflavimicrobium dichotomicum]SFJ23835.1 HSP20 family protein [Thermoflavimicrobium dichotomicum]
MHFLSRHDHHSYPLRHLRDEMNRIFQHYLDDPFFRDQTTLIPPINLREEANRYVVEAELPGLSAKDVQIEIHDNILTIRGEKRIEEKKEEDRMHVVESRYGSFQRSITLPPNSNTDMITAEHKRGILYIHIPKDQTHPPRKIEVKDKDRDQ